MGKFVAGFDPHQLFGNVGFREHTTRDLFFQMVGQSHGHCRAQVRAFNLQPSLEHWSARLSGAEKLALPKSCGGK